MPYLDNSATTQPCQAALDAAWDMQRAHWFNPSALYGQAIAVEKHIEAARGTVAGALGVQARELVFTSGGTEADSLAILGAASRFRGPRRVLLFAAEHPAVRETASQLAALGHQVDWMPATDTGLVDLRALEALLSPEVALVSCMHVGNETGAVQPVAQIKQRMQAACPAALLHVDGVQAFLRVGDSVPALGADLYSISAHKVHGPKGVGALAVCKGVRISPRVRGGGQESGLRSGTENTAGIVAFGAAVAWMRTQSEAVAGLRALKMRLYEALRDGIEGLRVNGPPPDSEEAAPHILNVSLPGVGGEVMVHALEQEGVLVGTGAACSSRRRETSAAFVAMGAPKWASDSAVRFSFSVLNTPEDTQEAAEAVLRCYRTYKVFQRR